MTDIHKEIVSKFGTISNFAKMAGLSPATVHRWLKNQKRFQRLRSAIDATEQMPLLSKKELKEMFKKRFNQSYNALAEQIEKDGVAMAVTNLREFFSKKDSATVGKRYKLIYNALTSAQTPEANGNEDENQRTDSEV